MDSTRIVVACFLVLAVTACGTGGDTAGTKRIVVLTPDDATEIVVPAGAFDEPITTVATTTTTQPPKETIPIEEEEVNPGIKLMDSLDGFNSCLSSEGWSFIGIPNQEAGPEDPTNNPEYIQALVLCNSRTGISEAFQEFQVSRSEMDPEEIREQNEQTIRLGDCLRGKGWSVGELTPNEDGLLNPTEFQSPDGDIDTNDIRDCISELGLVDEDE